MVDDLRRYNGEVEHIYRAIGHKYSGCLETLNVLSRKMREINSDSLVRAVADDKISNRILH